MPKIPNMISTFLLTLFESKTVRWRVIWKNAQWDSADGTQRELFEMFGIHGDPAGLEIYRD